MRIAIDAMGGDQAPSVNVLGAIEAAKQWNDIEIMLVGKIDEMEKYAPTLPANVQFVEASEVIGGEDEPVRAVRRKKDSSMVVAGGLVREGKADAFISAGNTGALMATALLVVGRMKGIERPALAPMLPTMDGKGVLALDLGANMDATPEQLRQYAIMGSLYRSKVHGVERPRVGLLNVGTEENKGNELTKEAYALLKQAPIHFIGNVESRDLLSETCDVVVCDGFVGNILLKSMEGTASVVISMLKTEFKRSFFSKIAALMMKKSLAERFRKLDYKEHGGAPLLGINGLCLKSHGSSDALAIKNAVRQARIALKNGLVESIAAEFSGK